MTQNYQITYEHTTHVQQHVRDANSADDCPDELCFEVEDHEVTVSGTAEAMRWFYDYLEYLKRAWRQEGEQWDADEAEEMANELWEELGDDLPEQQRTRKVQ